MRLYISYATNADDLTHRVILMDTAMPHTHDSMLRISSELRRLWRAMHPGYTSAHLECAILFMHELEG